MKASLAVLLAGTLLSAASLCARADETAPPPAGPEEHSAIDDFAAKRDAYVKRMNDRMANWGHQFDRYSQDAKAKGQQAGTAADKDLQDAWARTKDASRGLAAATKSGWDRAKDAFEKASRKMREEWQRNSAR